MIPAQDWGRMSRVERDAAYNNTDACPNGPAYVEALRAASAAFRAARPEKLDLRYGATERTAWDLFPAADPSAPCFVFIHGGYWQRNSRDGASALVAGILPHGWSSALPGYTLAPDAPLSQIVAEIFSALDWLAAEGPAHGIGGPILVSGWSAGGHLAAMAAAHPRVAAAMPISGVFELGPIRDTYLNEKLRLTDTEIATLSPLRLPVVEKPVSIAYGSAELPALCHDSRALHARRAAAHAPGALLPVAGANHFSVLDALRAPDGLLVRQAIDLLR
jgi:acetyl esterase/lipase